MPLSGTTRVSQHQEGKTNLDFSEARDSEWQWYQLGHIQAPCSRHITTPASHYSVFYRQDTVPAAQPTASNLCKATWLSKLIDTPGNDEIKSRCSIGLRKPSIWPCCWWHMRSSSDWMKWTCSDWVQLSNIIPHSSNCSGYCGDGSLLLRREIRTKEEPKNCNRQQQQQPPFYGHYTCQPVLAGPPVKNSRILMVLQFTACMPLLTATSAFKLGRSS